MFGSGSPRFAHRRQTGRVLPHRHTSYAPLLAIALLAGAVLAGFGTTGTASDYTVLARVAGPPPTVTPQITTPTTGTHFSAIPVDVAGTCEVGLIVKIYKNDIFAGSTLCAADGSFALKIDLVVGRNDLTARDYDVVDQSSPTSAAVTVYYDLPTIQPATGQPVSAPPTKQLIVKSDFGYRGASVGEEFNWPIELYGGTAPYAVSLDWGDGTSDLISRPQEGSYNYHHTYTKMGRYVVTVRASDAPGQHGYLQLVTIVRGVASAQGSTGPTTPEGLLLIWPLYAFLLVLVTTFWLGERYEKHLLGVEGGGGGAPGR